MRLPPLVAWITVLLSRSRRFRDLGWRRRLGIVIFAFPLLMTLAALGFAAEAGFYVLRSERVTGTVVERYEWPGETIFDRGTMNYEPIFTYDAGGETRRASVGSGHASFDVAVGQTAAIRVIPGSTGNVRMDTWQGPWFIPVILGGLALAAWVAALALWGLVNLLFFRKAAP